MLTEPAKAPWPAATATLWLAFTSTWPPSDLPVGLTESRIEPDDEFTAVVSSETFGAEMTKLASLALMYELSSPAFKLGLDASTSAMSSKSPRIL